MSFLPYNSFKHMVVSAVCASVLATGVVCVPTRVLADEQVGTNAAEVEQAVASSNPSKEAGAPGIGPSTDNAEAGQDTQLNVITQEQNSTLTSTDDEQPSPAVTVSDKDSSTGSLEYQDPTTGSQDGQVPSAGIDDDQPLPTTSDEDALNIQQSTSGQFDQDPLVEQPLAEVTDSTALAEDTNAIESAKDNDTTAPADSLPPLPDDAVTLPDNVSQHTYLIETGISDSLVLTATSTTKGSQVAPATYAKDKANTQTWRITPYEQTGWYRILLSSSKDGLALAVGTDAKLYLVAVTDDATTQLWTFGDASSGGYRLINASLPNWCVTASSSDDSSQARMQPAAESSAKSKRFYLIDTKPSVKAGSQDIEGAYTVTHVSSSRVIEVRGESKDNGADVWLYTANGKKHQRVYLERDAQGYYIAWIAGTAKVLDVRGSSIIPGTNVFQWAYTGGDNQKWAALPNGDGSFRLVNKATGLVLGKSSKDYSLVGLRDDGSTAGIFKLVPVDLLSAGIYRIRPHTNTKTCLDVRKASTSTAELMLYTSTNALNQRFQLVSAGDTNLWYIRTGSSGGWIAHHNGKVIQTGSSSSSKTDASVWVVTFKGGWYCLVNKASGKALDMRKGSTASGTSIIAYAPNGKDSQHFTFIGESLINEGIYYLKNAYGTRLDIKGASTKAGANVQTWSAKDSSSDLNQRFRVEKHGSYFRIVNAKSGLVVTPSDLYRGYADSSSTSITNVTQRLASGMNYQLWKPQIADGGYIFFVNVTSGKALTVAGSSTGANVLQQTRSDSSKGQRWKLTSATGTQAASTKKASTKVLMIGNSFTFFNDLPTLLVHQKSGVEAVACTRGSSYLADHASTTDSLGKKTRAAITAGGWDYVLIQAQSTEAIDDYDTYLANLTELVKLIRQSGATPLIYGTWAFRGGSNGAEQRYGSTSKQALDRMNSELQTAFTRAANDTGVKAANGGKAVAIANVGAAFAKKEYAKSLYCDNKHAGVAGSTLAAQTIAKQLK